MTIEKEKWTKDEIKKAAGIILKAEQSKSPRLKILEQIVHWFIAFIVLFGNTILNSFIIVLSGLTSINLLYVITIVLGLGFGIILEIPIRDIEKIDKNKHFVSRLMLPLLALVNVYILFGMKIMFEFFTEIIFPFNPLVIGTIYGISLVIPHYTLWLLRKRAAIGI